MDSKFLIAKSNENPNSNWKKKTNNKTHWTSWIGNFAILWSVLYGVLHIYWLLGGEGYPFKQEEGKFLFSGMITYLPDQVGGLIVVILCFIGVFAGLYIKQKVKKSPLKWVVLIYVWGLATFFIFFVSDSSLIASIAYTFLFHFNFSWLMINQFICIIGAVLWGLTGLAYQRKIAKACIYCGRNDRGKTMFLIRWSKRFTYFAALAPIPYAITRFAWAMGIPLGLETSTLEEFSTINPSHQITEWVFGSLCVVGSILTLGLYHKWGERFPKWFPFIGGKRVPILLAVIPAMSIAIPVMTTGLVTIHSLILIKLELVPLQENMVTNTIWSTVGPLALWGPWGAALALSTIAYYYRRRNRCKICGRGEDENI